MTSLARWPRRALALADDICARLAPLRRGREGSLVVLLFHSLYRDSAQLSSPELAPNQNITVDGFERFLDTMLEAGYNPVSPVQVDHGLSPDAHHLLVTFDDGYYNNHLAIDVLSRLQVPATFFVSSSHVLRGNAFWWDALARELRRTGATERKVGAEIRRMKLLTPEEIDASLQLRFGARILRPHSDLDRPFDAAELRDFAKDRWVHIGNHTCDHAILPNCTSEEAYRQIADCQRDLTEITGRAPIALAYPNGGYSASTVDAALAAGLRVGFTVRPCTHEVPMKAARERMMIGRYMVTGGEDFENQRRKIGARFLPSNLIKSLLQSAY